MTPPTVKDVKPFVPAKDFKLSRAFYKALGWRENWGSEGLSEFVWDPSGVLLHFAQGIVVDGSD